MEFFRISTVIFPKISGKFRRIFPEISQLTTLSATGLTYAYMVNGRLKYVCKRKKETGIPLAIAV